MKKTWSPAEIEILQNKYAIVAHPSDLIPVLNAKTYKAIKSKARKLGLLREVETRMPNSDSPETIEYLRVHYLTTSVNQMSIAIKRSETYVKTAMKRLGLIQPQELRKKFLQANQIKKGNVSFNKGKKQSEFMSAEAIERTKRTRFQKGAKNFNELHDGAITIRADHGGRPYKYIRVAKAKWELLQVYNWTRANGPVPKHHCVSFIDGNTMNCELKNLELITRKENMLRNSASRNLSDGFILNCLAWRNREIQKELKNHPELIALKRESLILNRTIYEQQEKRVPRNS